MNAFQLLLLLLLLLFHVAVIEFNKYVCKKKSKSLCFMCLHVGLFWLYYKIKEHDLALGLVCSMTSAVHMYVFLPVFRWILLCFKREFNEVDALRIWESCWAHYQTDYFHLFLCVAIVSIYGDDVVDQRLPADDILLHFSSLAMHMNGDIVLRKVILVIIMKIYFIQFYL